jgi:HK97 family phage major capsid protein
MTVREAEEAKTKAVLQVRETVEGYLGKDTPQEEWEDRLQSLPADQLEAIDKAQKHLSQCVKDVSDAKTAKKRAATMSKDLAGILGSNKDVGNPDPDDVDRSYGRKRQREFSGSRRRDRSQSDRPSRRNQMSWKPQGSRWNRTINFGENHAERSAAFYANLNKKDDSLYQKLTAANEKKYGDLSAFNEEVDARGGYWVVPEKLAAGIIKNADDNVFMLKKARVFYLDGEKQLTFLKRVTKADSFRFRNALTDITTTAESSLAYGQITLKPHRFMGQFWIHEDLLENATMNIEQLYMEEMQIDLDEMIEYELINGLGFVTSAGGTPLGVMTPDARGISTGRDQTYTATTTAFDADCFVKARYSLKDRYRNSSTWMLHRDVIAAAMILKQNNLYVWREGLTVAGPQDTLVGRPVTETEWMPNSAGAGLYYAILGDFSWYYVAFRNKLAMKRLDQIAARQGLIEYHVRGDIDGAPVLEEAFTRLKYAAS